MKICIRNKFALLWIGLKIDDLSGLYQNMKKEEDEIKKIMRKKSGRNEIMEQDKFEDSSKELPKGL